MTKGETNRCHKNELFSFNQTQYDGELAVNHPIQLARLQFKTPGI